MLHEDRIYYWLKGMKVPRLVRKDLIVRNVKLDRLDDDTIFLFSDTINDQ